MNRTRNLIVAALSIALLGGLTQAQYMKMDPPPDVDKAGGGGVDNSCWMATASNMLAGAGYGNGVTVQARADDIYADMVAHYGIANGGWIKNGLTWWLGSANNVWPANPYDNVTSYGNFTATPYNNADLPRFIGNELRRCQMVGVSITHPYGGHAITAWGDDQPSGTIPAGTQPDQIVVTDSDRETGGDTQTYNYSPHTGGGWDIDFTTGTTFIKHITTLCPEPEGYLARAQRTIHQGNQLQAATDLHFTAYQKESWVEILTYRTAVSEVMSNVSIVEDDWPQSDGKIHSITYDADFKNPVPYCTDVTVDVEFMLDSYNTVRFQDLKFTYDDGLVLKAAPDLGWAMYGIPRKPLGNDAGGDAGDQTDQDGRPVQSGFVVVQYKGQAIGGANDENADSFFDVFVDTFAHEFKEDVELGTHFLELELGPEETYPVEIMGLRYGFSPGYFTSGDELAAFNDWIGEMPDPFVLIPGQAFRVTLPGVPEPATLGLLVAGGLLAAIRRRRKA